MGTTDLRIVDNELVCRTYRVRVSQDKAIQARKARTGDSWSAIVRRLIDLGIAEEERIERIAKRKAR